MPRSRPQGQPTRGKTALNRLRQIDTYILLTHASALTSGTPLIVDVGYGAYPWTALEMFERWLPLNPRLRLLGLEIDAERVKTGQPYVQPGRIDFQLGGFNVAHNLGQDKAAVIRAYNVLRQYDESEVAPALDLMAEALAPDGLLIEGTSNPSGRYVAFDVYRNEHGNLIHKELVFGWNFRTSCDVDDFRAILPKRLIHHALDAGPATFFAAWEYALRLARGAGHKNPRVLWHTAASHLAQNGWPVDSRRRITQRGYLSIHASLRNITSNNRMI